jgi:hypothetical protein
MLQPKKNPSVPKLIACKIIWGGLLFSQALYIFIASTFLKVSPPQDETILKVFPIFASIALIISVLLPRFLWKMSSKKLTKPLNSNIEDTMVGAYLPGFIARLALFEFIALMGLGLFLFSGDAKIMVPYSSVSILGFFMNFPTKQKMMDSLNHE